MPTIPWSDLTDEHVGADLLVPFSWAPDGLPFVFVSAGQPAPFYDWATETTSSGRLHMLRWPDGTEGEVLHADSQLVELVDDAPAGASRG